MTELPTPPKTTPDLYEQDGLGLDAIAHAHYWLGTNCHWFISEFEASTGVMFGWAMVADRGNAELGYTSHTELATVLSGPGDRVSYDTDWTPLPLREAIASLDAVLDSFAHTTTRSGALHV